MGDLESLQYDAEYVEEACFYGEELPSPENEDVGGWAYEMCYLQFRIKPKPHLIDDELEKFYSEEGELQKQQKRLKEMLEPAHEDGLAYGRAMKAFVDHERYGQPYGGGYLEQPAEWRYVMEAVQTAHDRAESQTNREEAYAAWQRQQNQADYSENAPSVG